jgi:hypothetical protein
MPSYVNATQNTRTLNRFQYFAEDCDCRYCRYFISKKRGCTQTFCVCEEERAGAIAHGRIKRKRGWNRE